MKIEKILFFISLILSFIVAASLGAHYFGLIGFACVLFVFVAGFVLFNIISAAEIRSIDTEETE